MALPVPAENQPYCTVSALETGHIFFDHTTLIDNATSKELQRTPSLSFLLRHTTNSKKFLFDLGIRKDWENYPPAIVKGIKEVDHVEVPQDIFDALAKGGVSPLDIDTICLSHCHFDHYGHTSPFTKSEFIVGGETLQLFEGGLWPENPKAFLAADLLPAERTKYLDENVGWQAIGPFPRAYDFYGDGSLYVVDAPGHLDGHINLLVRTSPDGGWIYLAGDTAHHWNLITGKSSMVYGCDCAHKHTELAEQTILRVREIMKLPRVRVLIAHDAPWYDENRGGPAFFPGNIDSL
ncbi:Metallo-hydrolase/oxidoreductase [Macrolepiota fuliginosa MF-IS2]|uniref:Metallo-hydrolase/oxidoreductase n=1 Tax=Macrolepiota fuliginosa MF-IS2 TaxID=1400762 RepID=A0A9P5XQL2_9AGAR|nr:Metallo-hydrolase/oxidoreductase [Macrolepiota fuliginosa MF-IS2]